MMFNRRYLPDWRIGPVLRTQNALGGALFTKQRGAMDGFMSKTGLAVIVLFRVIPQLRLETDST